MLKLVVSLMCVLSSMEVFADTTSVEVTTMDGTKVLVSPDELSKAYTDFQIAEGKFNLQYENSDGSISVVYPKVRTAGVLMPIVDPSNDVEKSDLNGVCKYFHLSRSIHSQYIYDYADGSRTVILNADGKITKVTQPHYVYRRIQMLMCEKGV